MTTLWNGWFGLGGKILGAPAIVLPTPGTIDIYARGMDNRLWQKWWDGTKWNPSDDGWTPHEDGGFRIGSAPAVAVHGPDHRDVYVRGLDGGVYHKVWDGKKWSPWFGLGGTIQDAPAVVKPAPNTVDIYVRGMDNRLWQKWWDGTKWNPSDDGWLPHEDDGFRISAAPSVVAHGPGFRDVYVRGLDGGVYHKVWNGKKWSPWFGLGGTIQGAPTATMPTANTVDIYVRGMNGRVWQKWWDGKWNPSDLGWAMHHDGNTRVGSAPSVTSHGIGQRMLSVRNEDGSVLHKFYTSIQRRSNAQTIRADSKNASAWIDAAVTFQTGTGKPGAAVAVIKKGKIVHLAGYGSANVATGAPMTSETMLHVGSCGKMLTALGIMMLEKAGQLEYDDHIGKHIPELAGYPAKVTLRRLLNHTSGILDLYNLPELTESTGTPTNTHLILAAVKKKWPLDPNLAGPGKQWAYTNSGYDLLGSVIERVSGQSYPTFFRKRVFDPCGMTDSFSLPDMSRVNDFNRGFGHAADDKGQLVPLPLHPYDGIVGAGSFFISAFDFCALEEALATNLLVSATTRQKAQTSGKLDDGTDTGYGFGWWIGSSNGMQYVEHGGGWNGSGGLMRRCLNQALSIYAISNSPTLNVQLVVDTAMSVYKD